MSRKKPARTGKAEMAGSVVTHAPPLTRRKKLIFSLVTLLMVPTLLLVLLEVGLRLGGVGYPTSFFLTVRENGVDYLINNDKFGWRFFPKELARSPGTFKFVKAKAPGTYRIFVFGESAALGDPKPAFGMGRYLEVLLNDRFPTARFEVITVAMTAINSHAILPIARECGRLEGDFWVVYMGNNEMAGPFGVNPIYGPSSPSAEFIRLVLGLRATRIGQLIDRITEPMNKGKSDVAEWEGMKMFRERHVMPGDPRKKAVYENFRKNLRDILQAGSSSGTKPIVCTVASNQRDSAPFASMSLGGATSTNAQYLRGIELQSSNLFQESSQAYGIALEEERSYADLHFRFAQVSLELGSNTVAMTHFGEARDLDALPLRTDAPLNSILTNAASEARSGASGVSVLDLDAELGLNLPAKKSGDETFFDHVHFNFSGNYRAAKLIAEKIESALPSSVSEKRALTWPSAQICDRALGLTDWNRRVAYEQMLARQSQPPFTDQSNHSNRIATLVQSLADLRGNMTGRAATNARAIYEAALQKRERDFHIRENFAEFLEATGNFAEAAEQRLAVAEQVRHDPVASYQAGRLLLAAKKGELARSWLTRALEIRPNFPEAHLELGRYWASASQHEAALRSYAEALKQRPDDAKVMVQRAHSLAALGRRKEAMNTLRQAIQAKPDAWEPRYLLGIEFAADGSFAEAMIQFAEVTRLRPGYVQAHFNLAVALAKLGKLPEAYIEFQRTLQLDPNHKSAQEYLAALEAQRIK